MRPEGDLAGDLSGDSSSEVRGGEQVSFRAEGEERGEEEDVRKKLVSRAPHSSSRMPVRMVH
jgi:hypothetical protein